MSGEEVKEERVDVSGEMDDVIEENTIAVAEISEEKKQHSTLNTVFLLLLGLVVVFVVVVLFYASKHLGDSADRGRKASPESAAVASLPAAAVSTQEISDEILVLKDTEYNHYNGNLSDRQYRGYDTPGATASSGKTAAKKTPAKVTEADTPKKIVHPADNATVAKPKSAPVEALPTEDETARPDAVATTFSATAVVGLDEDDARAAAKSAGYTVYSAYVCDAAAVKGGTTPKAGLVLNANTYTGRGRGEKYVFLSVATSDPYHKATAVPKLQGKAWKSARAALKNRGLGTRFTYEDKSPAKYGTVVFQYPEAGAYLPKGSTAVIVLAD